MFKHANGIEVQSKTMGIRGIILGRAEHLYGCNRYLVQLEKKKDGSVGDTYWCDEDDLEMVGTGINKPSKKNTGGPAIKQNKRNY